MNLNKEAASRVAEYLLQIKAIILKPHEPFTWASGWKSPIYCDNRKTLSYPRIRTYIRQQLVGAIDANFGKPDVIAGVATGGIAQGALVAEALSLPFVYVRPDVKAHGLGNSVEGVVEAGQSVIIIEDLVSTGRSSLAAVRELRDHGCLVKGMLAIFNYGFQNAVEGFRKANCPLITLTDYHTLLEKALETNYISHNDMESLHEWHKNPENWAK